MTEQEKNEFEKEIRQKVLEEVREEARAKKAEWRRTHKENVRRSNQKWYAKNGKAYNRCRREAWAKYKAEREV